MKRLLGLILIELRPRRISLGLILVLAVLVAIAQDKKPEVALPGSGSPQERPESRKGIRDNGSADAATPKEADPARAPSAEFLAKYDKLQLMFEVRGLRQAQFDSADNRLAEQIDALVAELRAQVPAGYEWNNAQRSFVKIAVAAAPAAPPATDKGPAQPPKEGGASPPAARANPAPQGSPPVREPKKP